MITLLNDDWHGLYRVGWKGLIVDEAFAHPAKFSRALIRHIYEHMRREGCLSEGDTVIDPFGGVALGGLDAARLGLNWIGVELEPKFVALAEQNIALWNSRYSGKLPKWGSVRIVQGDSRHLLATIRVVREAGAVVSSPPFAKLQIKTGKVDESALFTNDKNRHGKKHPIGISQNESNGYGLTPGQLAALREGDLDAAISSPPYADGAQHTGGGDPHPEHIQGGELHYVNYGGDVGNLGNLRADGFEAAVSSPPWGDNSEGVMRADKFKDPELFARDQMSKGHGCSLESKLRSMAMDNERANYGNAPGQLGSESGDTFWSAARVIAAQTFAALRPGGHAVWVLKSFVRNGERVDFPGQWRKLCESVGFETLHIHHAWLVEEHGTQMAIDGNHKSHRKERKSFFRRLAEAKGSPRIDFEVVLCQRKP